MAVLYAVGDRVATITLDRPHRLNAYDVAMRDELWAALAAAEALAMGIVTRVVAPDALAAEAEAIAAAIARLAPALVRSTRRAVCDGLDLPVAAGLALETRLALTAGATHARETA